MARVYDEEASQPAGDVLSEACGVVAVYAPGHDVARLARDGLSALQHRGQESAGIAVGTGNAVDGHRSMGLVADSFAGDVLDRLRGRCAIGHTRYSTSGSSDIRCAQPYIERSELGPFAFGHNGNLTNAAELATRLPRDTCLATDSDSEILAKTLAAAPGATWAEKIEATLRVAEGAYSVVVCTPGAVYGFRDPWGIRPLCLGTYGPSGAMIASESRALARAGAAYVREIAAGEIVTVDEHGILTEQSEVVRPSSLCTFEHIYFTHPDSLLGGRPASTSRYEMGRALARQHPADADVVMAIPDSAIPGGMGYADASGLPYVEGMAKNRGVGRTFIEPDADMRAESVRRKFSPIIENVRGRRVVVVDDSIVRGTTTRHIVSLLREAGVCEVHLRIASPPIVHPCFLGIAMASYAELISANLSLDQVCESIGADSLRFLSIENLVGATGHDHGGSCLGCLNGSYPSLPASTAS